MISIWPRCRSGNYLVTLEYPQPIKTTAGVIAHIDAFLSELCLGAPKRQAPQAGPVRDTSTDAPTANAGHTAEPHGRSPRDAPFRRVAPRPEEMRAGLVMTAPADAAHPSCHPRPSSHAAAVEARR